MAILSTCGIAALFAWYAYSGIRGRHLLRVESRYTAATITRVRRVKGQWESRYNYAVGGVRYTHAKNHGSGLALPVGRRYYVRYATDDPSVHEWPSSEVPDSIRRVPATGWSHLPWELPGTVPTSSDENGPRSATELSVGEEE